MRHKIMLVLLCAFLILGTFSAGAMGGAFAALAILNGQLPTARSAGAALESPLAQRASATLATGVDSATPMMAAVRATRPAVVTVWNYQYVRQSFFSRAELVPASSGSGVIFDQRGYIGTNSHVIDGAVQLEVVFLDGTRAPANVVGYDADLDVAVLKLDPSVKLPAVAPLADSALVEPGMQVIAIGSPLGTDYQNTVTSGIIAGLNRRVKQLGMDQQTREVKEMDAVAAPLIQTDAAINSGNSGGPLINLQGEVVGLNTLIVRRDGRDTIEGLGFAIPSNLVRALADEWIDGKHRGWLGIEFTPLDPVVARDNGLTRSSGALVTRVWESTPAYQAGLKQGDIVIGIGDHPLDMDHAMVDALWRYRAGERIPVVVDRAGTVQSFDVTLGVFPGGGKTK